MYGMKRWLGAAALAAGTVAAVGTAHAGETLDAVKNRGKMICGVTTPSAGWATPDDQGVMRGFDADICRAVAAAVFGDGNKVDFVPLSNEVRFQALQSSEIDLLSRQTTWTMSRDVQMGFEFGPPIFYDGQGLMVAASLGAKEAKDLNGGTVCTLAGTTAEQNLADWGRANGIELKPVLFENPDQWRAAFFSGRCDALTTDRSDLASSRAVANNPADYVILPEALSKEPLAPLVRNTDPVWKDLVTWTVYALMYAEEKGITQANVDEMAAGQDPDIQRFLGTADELGLQFGLDKKWAYNAIKAVGNYGEMFERNLGPNTKLGLSRGANVPWTQGGLQYAPPFR